MIFTRKRGRKMAICHLSNYVGLNQQHGDLLHKKMDFMIGGSSQLLDDDYTLMRIQSRDLNDIV